MSHEKAIFDGVRTRLGVRKSREMTLRIHRLENNEYWKDRSSPQTSDTISPIRGLRPRPYEPPSMEGRAIARPNCVGTRQVVPSV